MRTKRTKKEVLQMFRDEIKPHIERGDIPATREAWHNFTDMLCKDGDISDHQYDTWTCPF